MNLININYINVGLHKNSFWEMLCSHSWRIFGFLRPVQVKIVDLIDVVWLVKYPVDYNLVPIKTLSHSELNTSVVL